MAWRWGDEEDVTRPKTGRVDRGLLCAVLFVHLYFPICARQGRKREALSKYGREQVVTPVSNGAGKERPAGHNQWYFLRSSSASGAVMRMTTGIGNQRRFVIKKHVATHVCDFRDAPRIGVSNWNEDVERTRESLRLSPVRNGGEMVGTVAREVLKGGGGLWFGRDF